MFMLPFHTTESLSLQQATQMARWFHALSDETRLRLLACLSEGERCVCDLTALFETGQSRLSFHLKTLKEAGIVTDRRVGRWVYYSLNPDMGKQIQQFVDVLKACCRKAQKHVQCCP